MDKKTKIVLISIAIVVIFLIGFLVIIIYSDHGSNERPENYIIKNSTEDNETIETPNVGKIIDPLITEAGCGNILDPAGKKICQNMELMGRAVANTDPRFCDKISDSEYRDHCVRILSQAAKNVNGCRTIGAKEWENVCIMEIAFNMDDQNVCDQINYPYTKIKCKAQINSSHARKNNDMSACLALPKASNFRNICIWTLIERNGSEICDTIKKTEDKNVCADWYYLGLALANYDSSLCGKIKLDIYRKTCLKSVKTKHTETYLYFDSDKDGLYDLRELSMNLDPFSSDTDKDGVSDYVELFDYHSDPLNSDTDGDGRIDGEELNQGKDINIPD